VLQTLAKHAFAGAFDDNAVRVMVEALDQPWKAVQENGVMRIFGNEVIPFSRACANLAPGREVVLEVLRSCRSAKN